MIRNIFIVFALTVFSAEMNGQNLPPLRVSAPGTHLMAGETPFLWIGDTSWELIHRCNREEIDHYLKDRASKGFNVIQTVILAEIDGLNTPNAEGNRPLLENDPRKPQEQYFELVDYVVESAEALNMYVALLPTWGDKFNKRWGAGPEIFTEDNARAYGRFLGERYRDQANVVWVLGGDRIPESAVHFAIINAMASGIRDADSDKLLSYHPSGGSVASEFFGDADWLNINMFQSGHSRVVDEVDFVKRAKRAGRPVVNGESRYENIEDRFWEDGPHGWLDDADVRISAYRSILAGAAGYTYGCNDIWQMYRIDRDPVLNARTGWRTALDLPGAGHMGILKDFFQRLPWTELVLDDSMLIESEVSDFAPVAAKGMNGDFALVYLPVGQEVTVDLEGLHPEKLSAWWFNPRSGEYKQAETPGTSGKKTYEPWADEWGSDFILMFLSEEILEGLPLN